MAFSSIAPFPYQMGLVSNVTPFTYRDGESYLDLLEDIRTWLNSVAVPNFNEAIDNAIAEFQKGIANAEQTIIANKAEWQNLFDAFMVNLTAEIKTLNDGAFAELIGSSTSETQASIIQLISNDIANTSPIRTALTDLINSNRTQIFAGPALGIVGDGVTNDTAAINAAGVTAATFGLQLVFDGTKTYAISGTVTFPPNTLTNNAKFKKTVNNNTYALKTPADFRCDSLRLEVVGGAANDAGVWVANSNTDIGSITVTSLTADQPGANALLVGDSNTANTRSNIKIRSVNIQGFQLPMHVRNVTNSKISNGILQNFVVGLYVRDAIDTVFEKFEIKGMSPSATGTAGNNGVLVEATIADQSVKNLTFRDIVVENSAEHAFRIGGALSCINVLFERCIARKPGFKRTGVAGTESTGGAGFKSLGVLGHEHRDIRYVHCTVEDGNYSGIGGVDNHSAFNMGFNINLTLDQCIIRANEQPISAMQGLILFASSNVDIVNCRFTATQRQSLKFVTDNVEVFPRPGLKDIRVLGGFFDGGSTSTNITLEPQMAPFTNINMRAITVSRGGGVALRCETPTTVGESIGAYTNVTIGLEFVNSPIANGVATGNPPINDPNQFIRHHYVGPVYGAFSMPGADGSTELNSITGVSRVRKASAWVTV